MNKFAKSKNNIDIALTTTEGSKRRIINIETEEIIKLSDMIASKFNLTKDGNLIHDIVGDQGSQKYKKDKYKISIGWGPFFPFIIWAENLESDKLVEEIFDWLKTIEIPV